MGGDAGEKNNNKFKFVFIINLLILHDINFEK